MMRSSSLDGEVLERDATDEVDVAVGAEREAGAVHRVVAPQQELVELEVVLRRQREEVHLVAQRALVQVEVDRGRVAAVAREAHVPATQLGVVLDSLDVRLRRDRTFEVRGDELVRPSARCSRWLAALDGARAPRGRRSDDGAARRRCSSGTASIARVRVRAELAALVAAGCGRSRAANVGRIALVDEEAGDAVVDEQAEATDVGGDDRGAARGRLERDEAERLGARRHDAHVGGAVVARRAGRAAAARRSARGARARARRPARAARATSAVAVGAARTADDHELRAAVAHARRARASRGRRP